MAKDVERLALEEADNAAGAVAWSRRNFLRVSAMTAGGLIAAAASSSRAQAQATSWPEKKPAGWDELVAAANKEGSVVIYGPPGDEARAALVTRFQRLFPAIKVELLSLGAQSISRITAERAASRYFPDLFIYGGTLALVYLKPVNAVAPIEPLIMLPEILDPKAWAEGKLWWLDAAPPLTALMFQGVMLPPFYINTKMAKVEDFNSYWDFVDPKWKGKICSNDIRVQGPGGVPASFMFSNPAVGRPWFEKFFGTLDVRLGRDQRQLVDWVVEGQYPIGAFLATGETQNAMDQGLPIAPIPLDRYKEGGAIGCGFGALNVMTPTPHPNATKLYINWLLSRAGQIAWQEETKFPSMREDIPTDGLLAYHRRKPGVTYVNGSEEKYARLLAGPLKNAITDILGKAGRPG